MMGVGECVRGVLLISRTVMERPLISQSSGIGTEHPGSRPDWALEYQAHSDTVRCPGLLAPMFIVEAVPSSIDGISIHRNPADNSRKYHLVNQVKAGQTRSNAKLPKYWMLALPLPE